MQSIKISSHYLIGGTEQVSQDGASRLSHSTFCEDRLRNCGGPAGHCACASRGPGWSRVTLRRTPIRELGLRDGSLTSVSRPGPLCQAWEKRTAARLLCQPGESNILGGCRAGQKGISVSAVPSLLVGVFFPPLSSRRADPGFSADSVNGDLIGLVSGMNSRAVICLKLM